MYTFLRDRRPPSIKSILPAAAYWLRACIGALWSVIAMHDSPWERNADRDRRIGNHSRSEIVRGGCSLSVVNARLESCRVKVAFQRN
jgi:hypothetical protein